MKLLKRAGLAVASLALVTGAAGLAAAPAFADSTGSHGQPSQSCEDQPRTPGKAGTAPGSAFSGGTADSKYAGTQPQNSVNPKSVSQYDVACFQVSSR
ncbi:adenylate cyclase [Streptomyces sp. Ru71]|uniref:adenylate cyclase n=1 Tax=Streptomyces sp. Ru71 TaxID=2080746 RepID=UPI000CDE462B|nr:adenylate cyclase [Streptomyces sp. Ru71]POX46968.1 adenylate cyclase [Streptomyces sp. Ru71]